MRTIEKLSNIWSKAKYIVLVLIISFVIFRLVQELKTIDIKKSIGLFKELDTMSFIGIVILGILAILFLSLYDVVLKRTLKIEIPYKKLIPFSFITNALNNIIGFGGLFGSGLRYYFYKDKTEDTRLLKAISQMLISLVIGLGFLSILVIFRVFDVGDLESNFKYTEALIYVMAIIFVAFIVYTTLRPLVYESRFFGVKLATVSVVDWFFASGILYLILKVLHIDVPYGLFLGVFTIAAVVGLISMIPGGFGAFDLVILLGLGSFGVTEENLVLALLLYRISYYFAPFAIALVLALGEFKQLVDSYLNDKDNASYTSALVKDVFIYIPAIITGILTVLTGLVYTFGHVLILYNLIYSKTPHGFYLMLVINIAACFILIASAFGVASGSRRAYLMSIIASILMLATTMLTYGTVLSGIWLITLIVILIFGYRKPRMLARPLTPMKLIFMSILMFFMMYYNYLISSFILTRHKDTMLIRTELFFSILGVVFVVSVVVFAVMNYQIHKRYALLNRKVNYEVIQNIIREYGGDLLSHLAFSGDKSFYTNPEKSAFIMYKRVRDTVIVLGDPVGEREAFVPLLESFYDEILYIGYDVVFYQVQNKNLPLYHEFGNVFFKLGEEALIPLEDFTIQGKKQRAFRSILNRMDKEGYAFGVIEPPYFESDIKECRAVSEKWLDGRSEMHFSVGQFDNYYLRQAPIGVIRDETGEIVAFTSFMPVNSETMSVDLIRWNPDVELPMMDALYLNMLLYSKEHGYKYFNMGMATLSNVGQNKYGYLREKLAGIVFEKGSASYNFSGLRHYKQKYKPVWEDRYLVYRKYSSIVMSLLRVMVAIRKP